MKLSDTIKITIAAIAVAMAISPAHAAKGGKKGGNDGDDGGGHPNTLVALTSHSPDIPYVESNSFSNQGQVVFYGQMDLSEFPGEYDNGAACSNGLLDGIIVIYPQSSTNPLAAEMIFWYEDVLQSGDAVTHLLTMTGHFDEPDNWPPAIDTTVTLEYWEFAAENRKAQRQDCSGSYEFDGAGPWTVTVSRVQ